MPEVTDPKKRESSISLALMERQEKISNHLPVFMREQASRFFEVALSASKNEQITKCTPMSVIEAVFRAAQWGLVVDGVQSALVPYGTTCTFVPMYRGLIAAYRRSGEIKQVWADLVHEGDEFDYEVGMHPKLRHVPKAKNRSNPDGVRFAYACARWADGHVDFVVMTIDELEFTRRKSRAQNGPWKTDTCAMYLKTPLRRLSKFLPLSVEIQQLVTEDEKLDSIDVEGEVVSGPTTASSVDELLAAREKAAEEQRQEKERDEAQSRDAGFPGDTETPAEPQFVNEVLIGSDTNWEKLKDEAFGGTNPVLSKLTPMDVIKALLEKNEKVTAAAKAALKTGQEITAEGKRTPAKAFQALALAFREAEQTRGF